MSTGDRLRIYLLRFEQQQQDKLLFVWSSDYNVHSSKAAMINAKSNVIIN